MPSIVETRTIINYLHGLSINNNLDWILTNYGEDAYTIFLTSLNFYEQMYNTFDNIISKKIGDFSGTYFQRTPTKPIVAMAVKGAGEWSVTINSLKSASLSSAKSGSGSGTNVINLGKATSGIKRITWSHTGDGVFSVTPIDTKGKPKFPLFLKIGNYSGTVMLPSGTQYFEVKADGPWNYSIK
jgi:hypothetical protein